MLKHEIQLSTAASNARADDTSSCRKATAEYIIDSSEDTVALSLKKKSDRGWNNCYTARLLCPLKRLPEFDNDPEYVATLTSMIGFLTSFVGFSWARFSMEPSGSRLRSGPHSYTHLKLCTIQRA